MGTVLIFEKNVKILRWKYLHLKFSFFVCDIDEMVFTSFVVGYPSNFYAYSNYQAFVLTQ